MKALWNYFWVSATLLVCATAAADAPPYIPMQGFLTDLDDQPLSGEHDFVFSLYPSDTADTPFYQETQTLPVDAGHFTAYLGDVEPLDLGMFAEHEIVFVGIRIDDDQEIEPRMQLATAPFAAFAQACGDAETLGGMGASDFAPADHAHDYGSLTNVPASFPPSAHMHGWTELSDVPAGLDDGDDVRSQAEVQGWARDACFDTTQELRNELDSVYATAGHGHSDLHPRLSGSCPAGQAIVGFNANGTYMCADAGGPSGDATSVVTLQPSTPSTEWTLLTSDSIPIPTDGKVLAIGTGSLIDADLGSRTLDVRIGITRGEAPSSNFYTAAFQHNGTWGTTTTHRVFDVSSGDSGEFSLFTTSLEPSGALVSGHLSLVFIPD